MSTSSENLTAADVTRQAELVAMEYLKSMKCTHTLDAMMQKSSKSKSSSVVASELYAADLDSKKKAPQEFKSILEYMISTSSSSARMVSETSASVGGTDGSAPRSSRRRSSSVSSDSEVTETIWTKADVSRLKKAIKQTTSVEDKNDRWKEIALLVGNGKSKKHCYVKYKELKEEKKSSGSGSSSSRGSSPSSSSRRSSVEDTKSGKALPTAGGSQGEPEKVKTAKVVKENGDALTSQQSSLSATREEPSTPPLSSAPRSSVASELQMEDVEDFDTVHPTASQTSTQNRSNHGGDLQPVSSGSGSRGGGSRGGRAPTAEEIALLQLLLFSDDKKGLSSHWNEQGFFYTEVANLGYGLVQHEGGPCGVLAVVQAYVLRFLLASSPRDWQNPDQAQQDSALVSALAYILHQAAGGLRSSCIIALNERATSGQSKRKFMSGILLHTTSNQDETHALLTEHLAQLTAPKGNGLVLFVLSVILSKDAMKIKSEMDQVEGLADADSGGKLIGGHEYCTQEMVNLLICGQACSNVFNGKQLLEGSSEDDPKAVVLKGVTSQSVVGFLSLFEAYEYMAVGSHLKSPQFNIWVVCSESHYSVLFAEPKLLQDTHLDERRRLDLFYYDGLANQDEVIRLSIDAAALDEKPKVKHDDLVPPLNLVIQTKWPLASVEWHDVEPLL
ncbi:hypothetical protein Gpo141_00000394 [Globisporangium polare]